MRMILLLAVALAVAAGSSTAHAARHDSLRSVGVKAAHARVHGATLTLKVDARRQAQLTFAVLADGRVVARGHKQVRKTHRAKTISVRLSAVPSGSALRLRVTAKVRHKRGSATIALAGGRPARRPTPVPSPKAAPVATPLPTPIASASPTASATASPTPTPTFDLDDPYKGGLCPARAFPGDLNRLVRALPPGGDADGDGFTNAQEISDLNFDPAADPAKFNPLIADVPRVAVRIDGNFGLALVDHLENGTDKSLGTVNIDTTGSTQSQTDEHSKSVTDSHSVSVEVGYSKGAFSAKASYSYTHSETNQTSVSVSAEQRREASHQLNQVASQNSKNTIDGGSMIINATLSDPSNVAYVVDNMVLAVSARDVTTGRMVPFGTAVPTEKSISLAPGGAPKTLQFTLDGIGASDMKQLLDDVQAAGNLVFSVVVCV
jgi:hypothetical protein